MLRARIRVDGYRFGGYGMRRLDAIVVGGVVVAMVGIGVWFATMPYPIGLWWKACWGVRYSDAWPISPSDFTRAKGLVEQKLKWREIITKVKVTGPDEITFRTVTRFRNGLDAAGHLFVVRKANEEWAIAKQVMWLS